MNEREQKLEEIEGNSEYINSNNQNDITKSIERKPRDANRVLELLEVLEHKNQKRMIETHIKIITILTLEKTDKNSSYNYLGHVYNIFINAFTVATIGKIDSIV
jgi:hypothetical protein